MKISIIERRFETEQDASWFYSYEVQHQKFYRGLKIVGHSADLGCGIVRIKVKH